MSKSFTFHNHFLNGTLFFTFLSEIRPKISTNWNLRELFARRCFSTVMRSWTKLKKRKWREKLISLWTETENFHGALQISNFSLPRVIAYQTFKIFSWQSDQNLPIWAIKILQNKEHNQLLNTILKNASTAKETHSKILAVAANTRYKYTSTIWYSSFCKAKIYEQSVVHIAKKIPNWSRRLNFIYLAMIYKNTPYFIRQKAKHEILTNVTFSVCSHSDARQKNYRNSRRRPINPNLTW